MKVVWPDESPFKPFDSGLAECSSVSPWEMPQQSYMDDPTAPASRPFRLQTSGKCPHLHSESDSYGALVTAPAVCGAE